MFRRVLLFHLGLGGHERLTTAELEDESQVLLKLLTSLLHNYIALEMGGAYKVT